MVKEDLAKFLELKITPTSHQARLADDKTGMMITGETIFFLTWGTFEFKAEALVVRNLDTDLLAGMPFMYMNKLPSSRGRVKLFSKTGPNCTSISQSLAKTLL